MAIGKIACRSWKGWSLSWHLIIPFKMHSIPGGWVLFSVRWWPCPQVTQSVCAELEVGVCSQQLTRSHPTFIPQRFYSFELSTISWWMSRSYISILPIARGSQKFGLDYSFPKVAQAAPPVTRNIIRQNISLWLGLKSADYEGQMLTLGGYELVIEMIKKIHCFVWGGEEEVHPAMIISN